MDVGLLFLRHGDTRSAERRDFPLLSPPPTGLPSDNERQAAAEDRHRDAPGRRLLLVQAGLSVLRECAGCGVGPRSNVFPPFRFVRSAASEAVRQAQGASYRSEEHTSELQSLMRISYAVFCL